MTREATARTDPSADRHPGVPSVHVVVVAYGAAGLLDACLGELDGAYPVLVVDNSSDPAVMAVAGRHRSRYIDPGRNLGFAGGVNVGLGELNSLDGDVLLLNPDAAISPADVEALSRCLHADLRLACVAPAQVDRSGGAEAQVAWPFPSPAGAWVEAIGLGRLRRRHDFLIGSVLLVRGTALADVGRFDEQFFLYAEETDWQRRAHDRGWRVALCPGVVAVHEGAGTGGDVAEREAHFHASHERYLRKYHGAAGWQVYRAGAMVGAFARALVLRGDRGRLAAARFRLYLRGPCRVESRI
jgi:GT2 family glycosyltransferase